MDNNRTDDRIKDVTSKQPQPKEQAMTKTQQPQLGEQFAVENGIVAEVSRFCVDSTERSVRRLVSRVQHATGSRWRGHDESKHARSTRALFALDARRRFGSTQNWLAACAGKSHNLDSVPVLR